MRSRQSRVNAKHGVAGGRCHNLFGVRGVEEPSPATHVAEKRPEHLASLGLRYFNESDGFSFAASTQ